MPDGKTHYAIWKKGWIGVVPLTAAAFVFTSNPVLTGLVPVGYFLGRWIDPDLDLVGVTNAESRMMAELKLFGALLTAWFLPYAYLMRFVGTEKRKGHRNFFSHFPVIGTSIRVVWLFLIPLWTIWKYYGIIPLHEVIAMSSGLALADTFHYLADMFMGEQPNGRRKRK